VTRATFNKMLLGVALTALLTVAADAPIATVESTEAAEAEVPPRRSNDRSNA
jgi:hypothetical protein